MRLQACENKLLFFHLRCNACCAVECLAPLAVARALLCFAERANVRRMDIVCDVFRFIVAGSGHEGSARVCIGMRTTKCLTLHCDSKDDSPTI